MNVNKGSYIITVQPSLAGCNPDFAPDSELISGIEADGFLLLTMKDDKPHMMAISGLTTLELAQLLADDKSEAGSVIQQAFAIAEGLRKARDIAKKNSMDKTARTLAEMLQAK